LNSPKSQSLELNEHMSEQPPVLRLDELVKVFTNRHGTSRRAVDGVTLAVAQGQSLAIVGESGSGKTTIARMIVGLERQTTGRILVAGRERPPGRISTRERRRRAREAQMVFQDPYSSLDRRQRIADGLAELLRLHFKLTGMSAARRIDELLDSVGLDPSHGRARPATLSGGQRQRAAIAHALAVEPQLLILDEPVSALDVSIQAQVLNLLADIQARVRMAYLFISHDLAVVRQVCTEAAVMYQGKIVETGPVAAILDHPEHEYTRALRRAAVSAVPGTRSKLHAPL
jgi:oligopeptide transport system ATP-binding protein